MAKSLKEKNQLACNKAARGKIFKRKDHICLYPLYAKYRSGFVGVS